MSPARILAELVTRRSVLPGDPDRLRVAKRDLPVWVLRIVAAESCPVAVVVVPAALVATVWVARFPGPWTGAWAGAMWAATLSSVQTRSVSRTHLAWAVVVGNWADLAFTVAGIAGGLVREANPFFAVVWWSWAYKALAVPLIVAFAARKGLGIVVVVAAMAFAAVLSWQVGGYASLL
ncbi:MAG: DUF5658 family protein [Acidimicrobiales bacterium]